MEKRKTIIAVSVAILAVVICSFFIPRVDAEYDCPSVIAEVCTAESTTQSKLGVRVCMDPDDCSGGGFFKFYYRRGDEDWSWVIMSYMTPHDCESPCAEYQSSVFVHCGDDYNWEIKCSAGGPVILSGGPIYCPCKPPE